MKTKFTRVIIASLFFGASTRAQDRGYNNDHYDDGYKNDFR